MKLCDLDEYRCSGPMYDKGHWCHEGRRVIGVPTVSLGVYRVEFTGEKSRRENRENCNFNRDMKVNRR